MADKIKYITGGTLPPDAAVYQERAADSELLTLCQEGKFAYVLTSRQMGKSSLMARTALKLQEEGIVTAIIDLTSIGTRETSAEQWYLGVLAQIESFCSPETDVFAWWQDNATLSPAQRFSNYMSNVLLKEIPQKIVIFVDEIDSTLGLGFTDDFFAAIRAFHNGRATHPDLYRISFVLLGVATPDELIRDRARTPFNIGQAVELGDFGSEQILSLIEPLKLGAKEQGAAEQILKWTGGQPYLTQKLCAFLAENINQAENLEILIMSSWLSDKFKSDPHFQFITSYLADTPPHYKKEVFETYEDCYRGKRVPCRDASFAHNRLRLSGLLKRHDGTMIIRNEIYRKLFDLKWIKENRPTFWTERNKKIALYVFSAACMAVAASMVYLWLLSKELAKEATSLRLKLEAQSILSEAMAGSDIHAMQLSAAAFRILPSNKSYGGLLETLTARSTTRWIAESTAPFTSVVFSPDGKHIVSGSWDGTLRLWDATTGQPIGQPLKGHESIVTSVVFSPDGKRIVSGSADKTLRLWDAETGQSISQPLKGHETIVTSVAFSQDGKRIVTGSDDKTLRLWDAETGQPIGQPFKGHENSIRGVAFSPDGKRIVSGSDDKTLRLWDAATEQLIGAPLKGHKNSVDSIAFSPDGKRIVSGSSDRTLRIWDAATDQSIGQPLKGHEAGVSGLAVSPDGKRIVSGSWDKTLRLWDATTGQPIGAPLKGHEDYVISVAFSPDGKRIVSGSKDKTLRLWDAATGQPIGQPLKGHEGVVYSVAFSPDGKRIISGSGDMTLRLWDAETGAAIGAPLKGHEDEVVDIAFSPDGKRIVSGSRDKTIRLWDAETGQSIGAPFKGHECNFWVDADTTSHFLSTVAIHQLTDQPVEGQLWTVWGVAFSTDGKRIVSGNGDSTLRLWDATTGQAIGQPLRGHLLPAVNSVVFSPDGKSIVSGSGDYTLRLWDTETGDAIGPPLKGHEDEVYSVAFSPDGKQIVSGSKDSIVRIWPGPDLWIDELCKKSPVI